MLPQPVRPLLGFAQSLRAHGFAVASDQAVAFIEAVGLLGPRDMTDIYRAARALLAIPKDREAEFDALFESFFAGQIVAAPLEAGEEDEALELREAGTREIEVELASDDEEPGLEASLAERLGYRTPAVREDRALRDFERLAARLLPQRRSRRRMRARHGDRPDLRRILKAAARQDGEISSLPATRRRLRPRRLVLLIDISGSMAERSAETMRFAHRLVQAAPVIEVFTLGTRLTRITAALKLADPERALARVTASVADLDGGTRIGEALQAFLAVPRYAAFARGAAVTILSDGLERDDPASMVEAVRRLSRSAWRLDWLSPLAASPGYRPQTAALAAVLPLVGRFGDGAGEAALAHHYLTLQRRS